MSSATNPTSQTSPAAASANMAIPAEPIPDEPEIFLDSDLSDEDSEASCFTAVGRKVGQDTPQEPLVLVLIT